MKVEPIHHVPMRTEYKSPFSAAYSIEGGRLIFFSGCCTVPTYHKHPHDPDDERHGWRATFASRPSAPSSTSRRFSTPPAPR